MGWLLDILFGTSKIKQLQKELAEVKAGRDRLGRALTQAHTELEAALDSVKTEQQAKESAEAQVSTLTTELADTRTALEEKQQLISQLESQLQVQYGDLAKENKALREQVQTLEQGMAEAIGEKEKELALVRQVNDELRVKIQELEAQLPKPMPKPTILGEITQDEANKLLREVLPKPDPYARDPFNYSDSKYGLTAIDDVRAFLQACQINKLSYITEVLDCDDFASGLHGHLSTEPGWSDIAEALVWGNFPGIGPHAWNLIIAYPSETEKIPTVFFVEPQSDHIWEVANENFEGLSIWLVVM